MKIALAALVAVLALVLGLGVLAKRTIESDAFQASLRERLESTIGASPDRTSLEWASAEAPLFSTSLHLEQPVVRLGPDPGPRTRSSLFLVAESGEARFDLRSLLAGRAELLSLRLTQGELELRERWRSHEFVWRFMDLDLEAERSPTADGEAYAFSLRVRATLPIESADSIPVSAAGVLGGHADGGLELLLGSLTFGAHSPSEHDGDASQRADRPNPLRLSLAADRSLTLSAALDFGPRGNLQLSATRSARPMPSNASIDGHDVESSLELTAELDAFDLALFPRIGLPASVEVEGHATGSIRLVAEAGTPVRAEIDVRMVDARLRMPEYEVEGIVPAQVAIEDPFSGRPNGRIELDLTHARFDYRGRFEKPPGQGATVRTIFGPGADGETDFESHVSLRDLHQVLSLDGSMGAAD